MGYTAFNLNIKVNAFQFITQLCDQQHSSHSMIHQHHLQDHQLMAALLVLLLLLAVPPTAFTTTDVYYVTAHDAAGHEQSCPPHQICHNLSYYISQPDSYFTSDTTIIFLEGEHSFDREDFAVSVSNVHNLTLKGQGQWPVAGAEETVMQSTVVINCTRGRGGFYFGTSHNITVEGLTVVNCGGVIIDGAVAVFNFDTVQSLFFHKNSIQHMTGHGLLFFNCNNVIVTNCSYYHSSTLYYGAVGIEYYTQYSNTGYTLELSHSNMTKCCMYNRGGGLYLVTFQEFGQAKVLFNHLKLSHNQARMGGGMSAYLRGNGNVILVVSNCVFFNGSAIDGGGLRFIVAIPSADIRIENTDFVDNKADLGRGGGISASLQGNGNVTFVISNCVLFNGTATHGGGLYMDVEIQSAAITIGNTNFVDNKAGFMGRGGGISASLQGNGNVTFVISNCVLFNGTATHGGGLYMDVEIQSAAITIGNTNFVDNHGLETSEMYIGIQTRIRLSAADIELFILNSTVHTHTHSDFGVFIKACCSASVKLTNTNMSFANVYFIGFALVSTSTVIYTNILMDGCQFIGSFGVPSIFYLYQVRIYITNSIFSNNTSMLMVAQLSHSTRLVSKMSLTLALYQTTI